MDTFVVSNVPASFTQFYRWEGTTRVEVHIAYDAAGRISAWGVWRNQRVHLDQEAGMRARLDDFLCRPHTGQEG